MKNKSESLKVLKLNSTATIDDIKQSYKRLALKYHPDKHINSTPIVTALMKIPPIPKSTLIREAFMGHGPNFFKPQEKTEENNLNKNQLLILCKKNNFYCESHNKESR